MSVQLTSRFNEAVSFASELHKDQKRKGSGAPYLSHLLRTAGLALEYGATEDEAIAAILHDSVEDCGGLSILDRIRVRFGEKVANVVLETSDSTNDDAQKKAPWRERKELYINRLRIVSDSAALVIACDKIDNATSFIRSLTQLRDEREKFLSKFKVGKSEYMWYFNSIVDILKSRKSVVAMELEDVVMRLEEIW